MNGIDTTLMETIANYGIMLILSGVIVVFLIKVLSFMLDQSKKMNDLAFTEVGKIKSTIAQKINDLMTLVTDNDRLSNNKLNSIENLDSNILEEVERVQRLLESLNNQNITYLMQMSAVSEIQKAILKDIKYHCPAVYSREIILNELIKRGYITREQIDEVISYLEEDNK